MKGLLAFAIVAAASSTASAGAFIGLGIGTAPATTGEVDHLDFSPDGRSVRVELGYRFGRFSIEGMGSSFDMIRVDGFQYSDTAIAIAAKYNMPLGDRFEAFGRAGLGLTYLSPEDSRLEDYSGKGLLIGGGFEYRLNLGAVSGSVFVDYTIHRSSLTAPSLYGDQGLSFMTRTWNLGVTVSL
jgi:hypothetical protein